MRLLVAIIALIITTVAHAQTINTDQIHRTTTTNNEHTYLPRLDNGLLDQNWYTTAPLEWVKNSNADFFWVKPGLSINGLNVNIIWEKPVLMSGSTDDWDSRVAYELMDYMPTKLSQEVSLILPISKSDPKLKLIGRTVECNVCTSLLFSAAMEVHTFDLKLIDTSTGDLLMAIHHRTVDGWGAKGNGIKRNAKNWIKKFSRDILNKYIN